MKKSLLYPVAASLFLFTTVFSPEISMAQWVKTNGPEGISITSFLNADTFLLAGTNAKGVYRSSDQGQSWQPSYAGLQDKWVECFMQDSATIFAGMFGEGVYRSADNGNSWSPSNAGIQTEAIVCILRCGNYLFAGSVLNGLFRSADNGLTWTDANGGALGGSYIHSMAYCNGRLMVEADNYIFYTYDYGNTWNVDQGTTQFWVIDDFYMQGDTLLALSGPAIFRSTDGGLNWSNPLITPQQLVGFATSNDTIYIGTIDGVYQSPDYGFSWTFISSSDLRHGYRELNAFAISNNMMVFGYEEIGVYTSINQGINWLQTPLSDFERCASIDDALYYDNGILYSGTHGDGVYSTNDGGATWTKIGTSQPLDTLSNEVIFDMLHLGNNIVFAGSCGAGLYRSADNGLTWTHITSGLPPDNGTWTCVKTLEKCGPNVLIAMTNGVYFSSDSGLTWNPTNLIGTAILQTGGFAVRGNIACVGVIGFGLQTGVYRSTDFGITWNLADPILDIETMATGGNHTMYAGELFTSYVSYDDGLTWNGLGLGAAFSILAWDNYVFIGNNEGVYYSSNYGSGFTLMNTGFDPYPNNVVQGLARDSQYVYAGLYRNGVWKRPLTDFGTTGIAESPKDHTLHIYPNPANEFVKVEFQKGINSLKLMNTSGEILFKSSPFSSTDNFRIDLHNYPPGIYILNVEGSGFSSSQKLVIIR